MRKTQFLIWAVIILFAMNVATIVAIVVSRNRIVKPEVTNMQNPPADPDAVRFHFFAQELGLSPGQMDAFRTANRNFNPRVRQLSMEMGTMRQEMVNELAKENPDRQKLDSLAAAFGDLHRQLKEQTINYYMELRSMCTPEQQQQLHMLFRTMLNPDNDLPLHRYGRGWRHGMGRRGGGGPGN